MRMQFFYLGTGIRSVPQRAPFGNAPGGGHFVATVISATTVQRTTNGIYPVVSTTVFPLS